MPQFCLSEFGGDSYILGKFVDPSFNNFMMYGVSFLRYHTRLNKEHAAPFTRSYFLTHKIFSTFKLRLKFSHSLNNLFAFDIKSKDKISARTSVILHSMKHLN